MLISVVTLFNVYPPHVKISVRWTDEKSPISCIKNISFTCIENISLICIINIWYFRRQQQQPLTCVTILSQKSRLVHLIHFWGNAFRGFLSFLSLDWSGGAHIFVNFETLIVLWVSTKQELLTLETIMFYFGFCHNSMLFLGSTYQYFNYLFDIQSPFIK